MGRIKTMLIKRTAHKLIGSYSDEFKGDFTHNKKSVDKLAEIHSKKIRNAVAGYIVRLKKQGK